MKKARLIFCGLLLGVALTGCSGGDKITESKYKMYGGRWFLVIDYGMGSRIYVDKETKVQYLEFDGGYSSKVAVLVDVDNKPILYEGEMQ